MPANNYFKAILGSQAGHGLKTEIVTFDDADPQATRGALNLVRDSLSPRAAISVWRRTASVPGYVPEIGSVVGEV